MGYKWQAVNAHIEILRPAIRNYGGVVEVISVDTTSGECQVQFKGPAPIGMGIQAAIKDKFPDIKSVVLLAAPWWDPVYKICDLENVVWKQSILVAIGIFSPFTLCSSL